MGWGWCSGSVHACMVGGGSVLAEYVYACMVGGSGVLTELYACTVGRGGVLAKCMHAW